MEMEADSSWTSLDSQAEKKVTLALSMDFNGDTLDLNTKISTLTTAIKE